jgi:beta-glucosidase
VLLNAGPLAVSWAHDRLPAVLAAWYPGEAGGIAIARALFGLDNPGGKLPYTVYANLDGVPPQNEYDVSKGYTYQYFKGVPLYPFGHGLSYTRYRFSNLKLSTASMPASGQVEVSFDLTNVGDRAGDEVAQLYTHQKKSKSYQPIRTLRAFQRVTLQPGETRRLSFTLPAKQLAWYQGGTVGSAVEPGEFDVGVGASSDNIRLRATVTVTAATTPHRYLRPPPAASDRSGSSGSLVPARALAERTRSDVMPWLRSVTRSSSVNGS